MHLLTSIFEWSSTVAQTGLCFFFFLMTSSECILDFHPMEEWECLSCMSMNCQHLKVWGVRWGQCDSEAMGSVDWVSTRMFAHTVNTPAVVFVLHRVLSCLDETVGLKWGRWCSRFKCSRHLSLNGHHKTHFRCRGYFLELRNHFRDFRADFGYWVVVPGPDLVISGAKMTWSLPYWTLLIGQMLLSFPARPLPDI